MPPNARAKVNRLELAICHALDSLCDRLADSVATGQVGADSALMDAYGSGHLCLSAEILNQLSDLCLLLSLLLWCHIWSIYVALWPLMGRICCFKRSHLLRACRLSYRRLGVTPGFHRISTSERESNPPSY